MRSIVDIALIDAYQISEDVKVVDVVVATVYVGHSAYLAAAGAPHLGHVYIGECGGADGHAADRIPYYTTAVEFLLYVFRHLVNEFGCGTGFIGTHVDIGRQRKCLSQLTEQRL